MGVGLSGHPRVGAGVRRQRSAATGTADPAGGLPHCLLPSSIAAMGLSRKFSLLILCGFVVVGLSACSGGSSGSGSATPTVAAPATSAVASTPTAQVSQSPKVHDVRIGEPFAVGDMRIIVVAADYGCPLISETRGWWGCPVDLTTYQKLPGVPITVRLASEDGKPVPANEQWWLLGTTGDRIAASLTSDGSGTWKGSLVLCGSASGESPGDISKDSYTGAPLNASQYSGTFLLPERANELRLVFSTGETANLTL